MHFIVVYGPCGICGQDHGWDAFGGISFDEELAAGVGLDWLRQFPLDIVMLVEVGSRAPGKPESAVSRDLRAHEDRIHRDRVDLRSRGS